MLGCSISNRPSYSPSPPRLRRQHNPPDLQRPRAQDARLLVLGHEGRRRALVVGDLLVPVRLVVALAVVGGRVGVARRDHVVLVLVLLLALVLRRAPRLVLVGRLGLGLVVLIGVLVEGGLVVAAGGLATGSGFLERRWRRQNRTEARGRRRHRRSQTLYLDSSNYLLD